jgi:hypothetical protein
VQVVGSGPLDRGWFNLHPAIGSNFRREGAKACGMIADHRKDGCEPSRTPNRYAWISSRLCAFAVNNPGSYRRLAVQPSSRW